MLKKIALVFVCCITASIAAVPTTMPALERGALEVRANEEFNRGQYALALPMLQKLEQLSQGQPDALGSIQEKIRVCQLNLATAPAPADAQSLNATRKPHPAPKDGEVMEMDIKDLGNFDFDADKGGTIPDDVQKLTGHTIRLHGFMVPMDQASNITQFALVPSLFSCCFGQPPQLQHTIVCNTPKGKAVGYFPDEIQVEGRLTVAEKKDEGFIVSIFQVDVNSVKPAAK